VHRALKEFAPLHRGSDFCLSSLSLQRTLKQRALHPAVDASK
jgi:hypothetical protein